MFISKLTERNDRPDRLVIVVVLIYFIAKKKIQEEIENENVMLNPAEFQVPPSNPAQNQSRNGQPFDPTQYGPTSFGTPQYYPGQQQPVINNQPQYGAPPVAGQY